jgi:hypothetical protein
MFEPGKYLGNIKDYGVLEAKDEGKYEQVFIEFEVVGRYDPATGELRECPPALRTYFRSTHPNSVDWLLGDLKSLGYDKPSLRHLDPEAEGAVNWFGKKVDFTCEHDASRDGTPREQWSIARERARKKKAAAATLARLDARLADKLEKAFGNGQPAPGPAVTSPADDQVF